MNITGTLNLKASSGLFTHAKSVQSVNHDINTRDPTSRHACMEVKFGFKKKIGSLSEGSVPVIFISIEQSTTTRKEI
jgi:hypothetical protein